MKMELNQLKEIMQLFEESSIAEMDLESEGMRVRLKKFYDMIPAPTTNPGIEMITTGVPQPRPATTPAEPAPEPEPQHPAIHAPMLGTFYRAPAPEADPFVTENDVVEPDTTVCIIEAMKLMNEIKAEMRGRIIEVLMENGQAVEYGQPLFLIEPL